LKKFDTQTFSIYMDLTMTKKSITPEPTCRTSQNKCHAHLLFIFHVYKISFRYLDNCSI